jgi:hypothetical protein
LSITTLETFLAHISLILAVFICNSYRNTDFQVKHSGKVNGPGQKMTFSGHAKATSALDAQFNKYPGNGILHTYHTAEVGTPL